MAMTWTEANLAVTAPGQIFELVDAEVFGIKTQVFKNAPAHLGQVFAGARGHGEKTFLVYEGETYTFTQAMDQIDALSNLLVLQSQCAIIPNGLCLLRRLFRLARFLCR
jgi:long-chain acyl-CoA synthetase